MASSGNGGGGTSGDVIQVEVQFISHTDIDQLIADVEGKLKSAFRKQIPIDLNVHFKRVSLTKAINEFATDIRSRIDSCVKRASNSSVTIGSLKLKIGDDISVQRGYKKKVTQAINDALGSGNPIKANVSIQLGKIDVVGTSNAKVQNSVKKAVQQALNQQPIKANASTQQSQKAAQQAAQQASAAIKKSQYASIAGTTIQPSFVDKSWKIAANTSMDAVVAYVKAQASALKSAKTELNNILKAMSQETPGSQNFQVLEQQAQGLIGTIKTVSGAMEQLKQANSELFSGNNANLQLQTLMSGIETSVIEATTAFDSFQTKVQQTVATSQEAQRAIQMLQSAIQSLKQAQNLFIQAEGAGLTGVQRDQLIKQAQALGVQGRQQYSQYKNAGFSEEVQKMKELISLEGQFEKLNNKTFKMDSTAIQSTEQMRTQILKLIDSFTKLEGVANKFNSTSMMGNINRAMKEMAQAFNSSKVSKADIEKWKQDLQAVSIQGSQAQIRADFQKQLQSSVKEQVSMLKGSMTELNQLWSSLKTTTPNTQAFDVLIQRMEQVRAEAQQTAQALQKFLIDNAAKIDRTPGLQNKLNAVMSAKNQVVSTTDQHLKDVKKVSSDYASLSRTVELYTKALKAKNLAEREGMSDAERTKYANLQNRFTELGNKELQQWMFHNPLGLRGESKNNKALVDIFNDATKAQKLLNAQTVQTTASTQKLQTQYQGLLNTMQKYQQNTPRLQGKQLGTDLEGLISKTQNALNLGKMDASQLNAIRAQFNAIQQAAHGAGLESKTFAQNLKSVAQNFAGWFSVSMLTMQAWQGIKQMVEYTKQLDTSMTELRKVTDESDATYSRFLDNAANKSVEVGAKLTDVVDSTAEFARLGYNIDQSLKLSEAALMLKNVGDGIESASDASDKIISAMKAFDIAPENALSIVDKYNEVGNNYAISSAGIAESLQRSAAAMATAGNTLDQSIALAVGGNDVTQNPEKVGG